MLENRSRAISASASGLALVLLASRAFGAGPQPQPSPPAFAEAIQVTASRVPEAADDVPVSIQVIGADELRDRGATDLKSALALAAGVDIAPGGDGGPASAVPEFWGLKELDAFLLVVDGVPWGGAFNPALSTLDLRDVERIEVQRGPAPVLYGATSFVGVIQVVRRSPTAREARVALSAGSYGSGAGSASLALPALAGFASALSADFERQGFADERTWFKKTHVLWSNRREFTSGAFTLDLDGTWLRQAPASPTPREGESLSPLVPLDSNQNPQDARVDENRYFARAVYDRRLAHGSWTTTLSYTRSSGDQLRGFLTDVSASAPNAAGFRAAIEENDLYFDTHVAWARSPRLRLVGGLDYLFGTADAHGDTFEYTAALDGSNPPSSIPPGEARAIDDTRNFAGLYANLEWSPAARFRLDGGLRLNHTREERGEGEAADAAGGEGAQDVWRLSGGLGASWTAWQREGDLLRLFVGYKNTFKPAAIDWNLAEDPQAEGESGILKPETASSYEAGVKTELLGRRLRAELAGFWCDFSNLVIPQTVGGLPALTNAGHTRLKGLELSLGWRLRGALTARGSLALHDARFREFLTEFDGVPTQLAGNRLEMSPHWLGGLALTWAPVAGPQASVEVSYVGDRYLDQQNTALATAYTTLSMSLGYRKGRWEARATGRNLTDRRDPVSESELGDSQYYRLFPRRFDVTAGVRF